MGVRGRSLCQEEGLKDRGPGSHGRYLTWRKRYLGIVVLGSILQLLALVNGGGRVLLAS